MTLHIPIGDPPDDGSGRQDALRFASRAHTTAPDDGLQHPRGQSTRRSTCACEPVARDDNIKTDGARPVTARRTARSIMTRATTSHEEPVGLTSLLEAHA